MVRLGHADVSFHRSERQKQVRQRAAQFSSFRDHFIFDSSVTTSVISFAVGADIDAVDEAIELFRANVLFRKFDIHGEFSLHF